MTDHYIVYCLYLYIYFDIYDEYINMVSHHKRLSIKQKSSFQTCIMYSQDVKVQEVCC